VLIKPGENKQELFPAVPANLGESGVDPPNKIAKAKNALRIGFW
jgi:hypothetical protein